jgi:ribosomal protein S18 acetylase RimI-like enzyme
MDFIRLDLRLAGDDDFAYVYRLCESTMRSYVEADLGDCFEPIARPTIQKLLKRGAFFKIYANDVLVGAVAHERHETHVQLEEIYLEAAAQNRGLGTQVMKHFLDDASSLELPIRLHVLLSNPARRFYERLGFAITRSTPEAHFMEYKPPLETLAKRQS